MRLRLTLWVAACLLIAGGEPVSFAASPATARGKTSASSKSPSSASSRRTSSRRRARGYTAKTFADPTAGDFVKGEDLTVREAAVRALGGYNGSIVVVDTSNGRVLSVVNQKLALSSGYIPCSTIKLVVSLAALEEGIVEPDTKVRFKGGWFMTMTEGLAISNNVYFAYLGRKLGFDKVERYAHAFGFGEKAGQDIPGEQLGTFSGQEHKLGVGRMMTFGDGISVTPLQLAAFVSAIANGGTLYHLQYPRTQDEIENFEPQIKRHLPGAKWIPAVREGMAEAVLRGTGKRAKTPGQQVFGKTGTCSQRDRTSATRLGWFASYNEAEGQRLAVVVLLRGGPSVFGPLAAEVAGKVYQTLSERSYFTSRGDPRQTAGINLASCCESE
jgi:cell division protein FtsI/penicillin-binding protein 2